MRCSLDVARHVYSDLYVHQKLRNVFRSQVELGVWRHAQGMGPPSSAMLNGWQDGVSVARERTVKWSKRRRWEGARIVGGRAIVSRSVDWGRKVGVGDQAPVRHSDGLAVESRKSASGSCFLETIITAVTTTPRHRCHDPDEPCQFVSNASPKARILSCTSQCDSFRLWQDGVDPP
jgi:hypothetical protein